MKNYLIVLVCSVPFLLSSCNPTSPERGTSLETPIEKSGSTLLEFPMDTSGISPSGSGVIMTGNTIIEKKPTDYGKIVGKISYSIITPIFGSGFAISGSSVYGDPLKIRVEGDRIYPITTSADLANNWKEIKAPEGVGMVPVGWGMETDTIPRRFYYYLSGLDSEILKSARKEIQMRYKTMRGVLYDENKDDPDVLLWKMCLTDIKQDLSDKNLPQFGLFPLCKYPVPDSRIFTSEKDLSYVRYSYSIIMNAVQEKNTATCDAFGKVVFDKFEWMNQFRLGQDHLLCLASIEKNGQMALDYIYGLTYILNRNRCEVYTDNPTALGLCQSIIDSGWNKRTP